MATQKVCKCGIKKQDGWLYFVDKNGDVSRAKMVRGGKKKKKKAAKKKVAKKKVAKKKVAKKKVKSKKRKR